MGAEKRKSRRRQVCQPALMVDDNGSVIGPCTLLDVSAGGARLSLPAEVTLPSEFVVLLSKYRGAAKRRCILTWTMGTQAGIRFPEPVERPVPKR